MNQIPNPGFEEDLKDWAIYSTGEAGTPSIDTGTYRSGVKSCHFINAGIGGGSLITGPFIPVTPGGTILFSAWGAGVNIVQGRNHWERLYVAGRFVAEDQKTYVGQLDLEWPLGTFGWTQQTKLAVVPEGAKYFRVSWAGLGWASSGEAWLDDFYFGPQPWPQEVKVAVGAVVGGAIGGVGGYLATKDTPVTVGATALGAAIGAAIGYFMPQEIGVIPIPTFGAAPKGPGAPARLGKYLVTG